MTQRGLIQTLLVVVIVIIVLVVLFLLRSRYERTASDFGTWSDFTNTVCLNEGQGCGTQGVAQMYRVCTPNPRTKYGCIDSNGQQTYNNEVVETSCIPPCYSGKWSEYETGPCQLYDDSEGSSLSSNQTCRLPFQFQLERTFRTCEATGDEGPSACVKLDGTIAMPGETEGTYSTCSAWSDCYPGEWQACPATATAISENCGGTQSECGEIILFSGSAPCTIDGVEVPTSNCYPPLNPGPCPQWCFNYPCSTWPAGLTNIMDLLGYFLEIFEAPNAIQPDWKYVSFSCDPNPIATTNASIDIVITTPAPHTMSVGEYVNIAGVSGVAVNGIPSEEINGFRLIVAKSASTFTIQTVTPATSTGSGGGVSVFLLQDPQSAAIAKQDVLGAYGPVTTKFANDGLGTRMRFRIIPSQAESPNGAFYLVAHLPYNGQTGIVSWNGSNLQLNQIPNLGLGETFDDVVPRPHLFKLTEPGVPQILSLYQLPGPVLTDLFCGGIPCLTFSACDENVTSMTDSCM